MISDTVRTFPFVQVHISNHLCLSGLHPQPVSYSILLTLYPTRSMPQSTIYYVSFSKGKQRHYFSGSLLTIYVKQNSDSFLFKRLAYTLNAYCYGSKSETLPDVSSKRYLWDKYHVRQLVHKTTRTDTNSRTLQAAVII